MPFSSTRPNHVSSITRPQVHKIGVGDSERTMVVAPKENCSSMLCRVADLSQLVDHIKKSHEIVMAFSDNNVTVSSFHRLLTKGVGQQLKTEVHLDASQFERYTFFNDRKTEGESIEQDDMPDRVNEEVRLVFSLKEVKAFLDFGKLVGCNPSNGFNNGNASGTSYYDDDFLTRGENPLECFFE